MRIAPFAVTVRPPSGWQAQSQPGGFAFARADGNAAIAGMAGVYAGPQDLVEGAMALLRDITNHLQLVGQPVTSRSGNVDRLHARYWAVGKDGSRADVALSCACADDGLGAFAFGLASEGVEPALGSLVEAVGASFAFGAWRADEAAMRAVAGRWRQELFEGNVGHRGDHGFGQATTTLELRPDGSFTQISSSVVSVTVPGMSGLSRDGSTEEGRWLVVEGHLVLSSHGKGCLTQPMRSDGHVMRVGESLYRR